MVSSSICSARSTIFSSVFIFSPTSMSCIVDGQLLDLLGSVNHFFFSFYLLTNKHVLHLHRPVERRDLRRRVCCSLLPGARDVCLFLQWVCMHIYVDLDFFLSLKIIIIPDKVFHTFWCYFFGIVLLATQNDNDCSSFTDDDDNECDKER